MPEIRFSHIAGMGIGNVRVVHSGRRSLSSSGHRAIGKISWEGIGPSDDFSSPGKVV